MSYLFTTLRKFFLLIVSELIGSSVGLTLIGWINRVLLKGKLQTLFVCYSVNKEYKNAMIFDWYAPRIQWRPAIAGIFLHKLGGGLTFGISADEGDISDPANRDKLKQLDDRMAALASKIGAKNVAYAGIIPGVMRKLDLRKTTPESSATVNLIISSLKKIEESEQLPADFPIIIIGSSGHIGAELVSKLSATDADRLVRIDLQHLACDDNFPEPLRAHFGKPAVAINVSRNKVLDTYLEYMWPGLVILNDVFPEADKATLQAIRNLGAKYYHLAGIKGVAFPKFPKSYAGSIPCCTALVRSEIMSAYEVHLLRR